MSVIAGLCLSALTAAVVLFIEKRQKGQNAVLDMSAVCDERITDFVNYGLFDKILLPKFVIKEAEKIAKKNNNQIIGDNIAKLIGNKNVSVFYGNCGNLKSLDLKILKLAKDLNARIITTDFDLNKMAAIRGIKIIDVNDLYETLKPIILPGYRISVFLVKEGKEKNQAIAFLDDGTTVVAENGKNYIGKKVNLTITSVLHTSLSRMLFGKILNGDIPEDL